MLTINAVCIQESKFQEQMQKFFLVNGNSKLDHALVLNKEIIFGQLDIFYKDVQKSTTFQLALNQKFSQIGMAQDAIPIILLLKWEMVLVEWNTFIKWWKNLKQSTFFISNFTEQTTKKDWLECMRHLVFTTFHTEQETERLHLESPHKLCMTMEEVM